MLTQEQLKAVLIYDHETGDFYWKLKKARWISVGDPAGYQTNGRIKIGINKRRFFAHRLAWLYVHGKWPDGEIDHINGNSMDNRIANLRDVSHQINCENQVLGRRNPISGLTGVYKNKNQAYFFSAIRVHGKLFYLGKFNTPEAAHKAFIKAKYNLHKGAIQ